jgi:SAM-dependent methyltransferase
LIPAQRSTRAALSQSDVDLARYYDMDVADETDDMAMYLALAEASDGPVLELASGSGRIAVPLAQAGHRVVGIDVDAAMLDRARARWTSAMAEPVTVGSLELVQSDMTKLALDERFDLAILAFNSLLVLADRESQQAAIGGMADHLSQDGRAVLDVWLPSPDDLALYDGRLIEEWVKTDPTTGEQVAKLASARLNREMSRATVDTFFDAWHEGAAPRRTSRRDVVQFVTSAEVLEMVEAAGLRPQIVAGDYTMAEFQPDDDRIIIVAAAATSADRVRGRRRRPSPLRLL